MINIQIGPSYHFQLEELVQSGLEGNELVSMLAWTTNTYAGPDLMQHPELSFDTSHLGPLLSETTVNALQDKYLQVLFYFNFFNDLMSILWT